MTGICSGEAVVCDLAICATFEVLRDAMGFGRFLFELVSEWIRRVHFWFAQPNVEVTGNGYSGVLFR